MASGYWSLTVEPGKVPLNVHCRSLRRKLANDVHNHCFGIRPVRTLNVTKRMPECGFIDDPRTDGYANGLHGVDAQEALQFDRLDFSSLTPELRQPQDEDGEGILPTLLVRADVVRYGSERLPQSRDKAEALAIHKCRQVRQRLWCALDDPVRAWRGVNVRCFLRIQGLLYVAP